MNVDRGPYALSMKSGANWAMGSAFALMESPTAPGVTQYLTGMVCTVCRERFSQHWQVIFLLIFFKLLINLRHIH